MAKMGWGYFTCTILLGCIVTSFAQADDQPLIPHQSIAMYGESKYGDGLNHFDYVNPDAPQGGTLKMNAIGSFDSFNPFIVMGQPAAGVAVGRISLIYETLMARSEDEPFSLYGWLAETVEVPEDRTSITFNLNPAARFSDGQPVTADDVIFSFTTLRDNGKLNHRTYYKKVASVEKLGERRVRFVFQRNRDGLVDREMPLIMGLMPVLPQHDWVGRNFNRTTLHLPIGSGAYRVAQFDPGHSLTFKRNPDYWGRDVPAEKGLYNFDEVRIDYYRDDNIALQAFKAGQFDLRFEPDATKWATAYDFPAVKDGRIHMERLINHRTEPATGFIFNTRHPPFDDPVLRAALEFTFDSEWINRNLFHDLYHRTVSFFPNSELTAPLLPSGRELEILNPFKSKLAPEIFTQSVRPPDTDGTEISLRDHLLTASSMLRQAGYTLSKDQLCAPNAHEPITFEILINDPAQEKLALIWTHALKRIGIDARVRTVDNAQYQARISAFNFTVTASSVNSTTRWWNSLSPGNEQITYWGSFAADQQGSRNYPGIKDSVVDALATAVPGSSTREDLVATTHALDRVLMAGHYTIPFYYADADDVAFWSHLHHPDSVPLYGTVLESWWAQ